MIAQRVGAVAAGRGLGPLILAVLFAFAACGLAHAVTYPALTGRIVDQADIIPPAVRASLDGKLADLEAKSGIQLVVATVPSLQGEEIEPYANGLFRAWKLGERTKNNGVLLLVAPRERRVRIEVGYGLEGTLTDAVSSLIISNAITPRFKAGDFGDGLQRGVDDIITVLTTDASEWQKRPSLRLDGQTGQPVDWLVLVGFAAFVILLLASRTFRTMVFAALLSGGARRGGGFGGSGSSGSSWGSSSGGGFGGGGGSSGGGGASGRW